MDHTEQPPPRYETIFSEKETIAKKKDKLDVDIDARSTASSEEVLSILSDAPTLVSLSSDAEQSFQPGRQLRIDARGIGMLRLPVPSFELEIPIYDAVDGSLAYMSTRSRVSSGNAILSHPQRGDLVQTTYFFGPSRDPEVKVLQSQSQSHSHAADEKLKEEERPDVDTGVMTIPLATKWTSRGISFTIPGGHGKDSDSDRTLEWSYAKSKNPTTGEKVNLIVLRLRPGSKDEDGKKSKNKNKDEGKILAELVRSKDTRTPGSKRCSAGNGGVLVIDRDADQYLDESLIVATCLVMLKREIDRRRMMQMAMIAGAGGGS